MNGTDSNTRERTRGERRDRKRRLESKYWKGLGIKAIESGIHGEKREHKRIRERGHEAATN